MALGAMTRKAAIVRYSKATDQDGFSVEAEETVAAIRCYREGRHGSERWASLAAFTEATDLFRFRRIPGVAVDETMTIVCEGSRYRILSVEDAKGRGMYVEALAKRSETADGKVHR